MTWKRIIQILVVAALVGFAIGGLVACSSIDEGTVIGKEYDDPDHWTTSEPTYMQQCTTEMRSRSVYNSTTKSYTTTYVPETVCRQQIVGYHDEQHYDGPHWRLHLRNGEDEGWKGVKEAEYPKYAMGDHYPRYTGGQG